MNGKPRTEEFLFERGDVQNKTSELHTSLAEMLDFLYQEMDQMLLKPQISVNFRTSCNVFGKTYQIKVNTLIEIFDETYLAVYYPTLAHGPIKNLN
jgi:hypothetical protein